METQLEIHPSLKLEPAPSYDVWHGYERALAPLITSKSDYVFGATQDPDAYLNLTNAITSEIAGLADHELRVPIAIDDANLRAIRSLLDLLNTRANIFLRKGDKSSAAAEFALAFRISRRLFEGRGTLVTYMFGTAIEAIAIGRSRSFLLQSLYRGHASKVLDNYPDIQKNGSIMADCLRADYQFICKGIDETPVEELDLTALELDWWGVALSPADLTPWPNLNEAQIDKYATKQAFQTMLVAEIDYYEGRTGNPPDHSHLFRDLPPRPRVRNRKTVEQFNRAVAECDNPIGKACLRAVSTTMKLMRNVYRAREKRVRSARFWAGLINPGGLSR